jgi:hypothetical protein
LRGRGLCPPPALAISLGHGDDVGEFEHTLLDALQFIARPRE